MIIAIKSVCVLFLRERVCTSTIVTTLPCESGAHASAEKYDVGAATCVRGATHHETRRPPLNLPDECSQNGHFCEILTWSGHSARLCGGRCFGYLSGLLFEVFVCGDEGVWTTGLGDVSYLCGGSVGGRLPRF